LDSTPSHVRRPSGSATPRVAPIAAASQPSVPALPAIAQSTAPAPLVATNTPETVKAEAAPVPGADVSIATGAIASPRNDKQRANEPIATPSPAEADPAQKEQQREQKEEDEKRTLVISAGLSNAPREEDLARIQELEEKNAYLQERMAEMRRTWEAYLDLVGFLFLSSCPHWFSLFCLFLVLRCLKCRCWKTKRCRSRKKRSEKVILLGFLMEPDVM
jgi:hypothetical protein